MKDKYVKEDNFLAAPVPGKASWDWKSIVRGRNIIELHVNGRAGNGKSLNFLQDQCMGNRSLGLEMEIDILENLANAKVSDFILNNMNQGFVKLQEVILEDKVNLICAILISVEEDMEDMIHWPLTNLGKFTIKLAFDSIAGTAKSSKDHSWI